MNVPMGSVGTESFARFDDEQLMPSQTRALISAHGQSVGCSYGPIDVTVRGDGWGTTAEVVLVPKTHNEKWISAYAFGISLSLG